MGIHFTSLAVIGQAWTCIANAEKRNSCHNTKLMVIIWLKEWWGWSQGNGSNKAEENGSNKPRKR